MLTWLERIEYGKPLQTIRLKADQETFLTYVFEWEVDSVTQNGLCLQQLGLGLGIYSVQVNEIEEREVLFQYLLRRRCERSLEQYRLHIPINPTYSLLRPVIFSFTGHYLRVEGYQEGEYVGGISLIPAPVPRHNLAVSPRCSDIILDLNCDVVGNTEE